MSISWTVSSVLEFKEAICVALSTAEAEYVAAGACCAQLLWMRQTLKILDVTSLKSHSCVTTKVP